MRLTGDLKKQVEQTKSRVEAKEIIARAGMELTDEELDKVTGGVDAADLEKFAKSQLQQPPQVDLEALLNPHK